MLPTVARQALDEDIWLDYVKHRNQAAVARLRGVDQSTVSRAVARYIASIPEPEKRERRERALDRLEQLYQDHRERARTSVKAGSLVRQVVMDQARLLGLEPKEPTELHVSGLLTHEHRPAPRTTDEVIADILASQGKPIPATLTRLDQEPTHA